jgi:hypothetical protein
MTFINENKDQIRIVVRVNNYGRDESIRFRVCDIMVKPYRKRKEISIAASIRDRYDYRVLDLDGRKEYVKNVFLEYCTQEQIDKTVQEEYEKLAPSEDNVEYACW